jgi:hypothetical protein
MGMKFEEEPQCSVCTKKATQAKVFLPITTNGIRTDACLCKKCFGRLPGGLHRQLLSNADLQRGDYFNETVLLSLKNMNASFNLNTGFVLFLLNKGVGKFEKFSTEGAMKIAIEEYKKQFRTHVIYGFRDGATIFSLNNS